MELGCCEQELTLLNGIELDKRLASVASEIYRQLGNISKELLNERNLYPGALRDKGELIDELQYIINKTQTDILKAWIQHKNKQEFKINKGIS